MTAPKIEHEISLSEPLAQVGRVHAEYRGRKLIYFGGCDYYRLASNAHLKKVAMRALQQDGLNVAASRVTTAAARLRTGLTPTPIASPGLASMQAAAHPARTNYLFFVRKPDKVHHFFTASEAEFYAKSCEYGFGCQ